MNLEDIIDPEYGLQQDEWSLTRPKFGREEQLEVIGWSGYSGGNRLYILKCKKCSQDNELFGGGYFKTNKSPLVKKNSMPCGCSKKTLWSKDQYYIICSRKATELGYTFLGFEGEWSGHRTKISVLCEKHGTWCTRIHNLNYGRRCPRCKADNTSSIKKKSDDIMINSFVSSGGFHRDTSFWRSSRENSRKEKVHWWMLCPDCGEKGESTANSLQKGCRPCACSKQRQQQAYINWIVDNLNNAVAIKFGIACNSKRRVKEQDTSSIYEVRQYLVYTFPDVASCKKAERECKKELERGIVSKTDMKDGWTETTSVLNLGKVKSIYERSGGCICKHEDT